MIIERDVYAAANMLIKQYKDEAGLFAAQRADELSDRGDLDGKNLWLRVLRAVEVLQTQQTPARATVH